MIEWLGLEDPPAFHPGAFDLASVNARLRGPYSTEDQNRLARTVPCSEAGEDVQRSVTEVFGPSPADNEQGHQLMGAASTG